MSHAAALARAVRELATTLELGACDFSARARQPDVDPRCACVPIVGVNIAVQVALMGSYQAFVRLGRKFLQFDEHDTLADADLADALCELANMFAGRVKAQLLSEDASIRLGLPLFIDGAVSHGNGVASRIEVQLGGIPLSILMYEQA